MIILYVNNYRGFQDTYIPLADVNFLVGENSSGKTSILSLLQVLSSEKFWATQEFGLDNLNLAIFQEVITAGCKDDFFEVGILKYHKTRDVFLGRYLKFVDNLGNIACKEHKVVSKTRFVSEVIEDGKRYIHKNTVKQKPDRLTIGTFFKKWVEMCKKQKQRESIEKEYYRGDIANSLSSGHVLKEYLDFEAVYELQRTFFTDFTPIAPIRAKPQRIYEGYKVSFTTEGDHIPYLLKSIMESANHSDIKKNVEIFGDNSGLFEKLQIKKLGDDNIAPFEIHISLNGNTMKLTNVGYGVSQILPILVEILSKKDGTWFAIQQPEVHLHPKAQAALGELFFNIAKAENKSFLIETHSDYLIDRYRLALRRANKKIEKPTSNAQVLFFERTAEGNKVHILPIDERGDYPEEQPEGFRDFFINEELNLLTY